MGLARDAGFLVVDVSDAWQGQDASSLRVRPWDWHPNARAHKLLADRIFEELEEHDERLDLKLFLANR